MNRRKAYRLHWENINTVKNVPTLSRLSQSALLHQYILTSMERYFHSVSMFLVPLYCFYADTSDPAFLGRNLLIKKIKYVFFLYKNTIKIYFLMDFQKNTFIDSLLFFLFTRRKCTYVHLLNQGRYGVGLQDSLAGLTTKRHPHLPLAA